MSLNKSVTTRQAAILVVLMSLFYFSVIAAFPGHIHFIYCVQNAYSRSKFDYLSNSIFQFLAYVSFRHLIKVLNTVSKISFTVYRRCNKVCNYIHLVLAALMNFSQFSRKHPLYTGKDILRIFLSM